MQYAGTSRTKPADKLQIKGLRAPVELRRHPTARRLTLRVSHSRRAVILTMPLRCSTDEAGSFLHRHLDWVRGCLDNLPEPVAFEHLAIIPLRGVAHRLFFTGKAGRSGIVRKEAVEGEDLPRLNVSGYLEHAPRRLKDWLIGEARRDLDERVLWHARNLSLRPRRITIRDQRTRWGSCSSSGCLSFSWRLILAPSLVLDYVAAHEVAHLAEMNHGPRFWQLVELTIPKMKEAQDWLRRDGMDLHRYGV